jgi:hypothetical protein
VAAVNIARRRVWFGHLPSHISIVKSDNGYWAVGQYDSSAPSPLKHPVFAYFRNVSCSKCMGSYVDPFIRHVQL